MIVERMYTYKNSDLATDLNKIIKISSISAESLNIIGLDSQSNMFEVEFSLVEHAV